jgi:hypothetical protein
LGGRLPYREGADISPATPNHCFLFKDNIMAIERTFSII